MTPPGTPTSEESADDLALEQQLEAALGSESEPDEKPRSVTGSPSKASPTKGSPTRDRGVASPCAGPTLSESFSLANAGRPLSSSSAAQAGGQTSGKRAMERLYSFDSWAVEPDQKAPRIESRMPSFAEWQMQASVPVELKPHSLNGEFPSLPRLPFARLGPEKAPEAEEQPLKERGAPGAVGGEGGDAKDGVRTLEGAAEQQPRTSTSDAVDKATAPHSSQLEMLPHAVLFRVLCCLSAEALGTMATTSKTLRSFSLDNSLWRRLYLGRWRKPDAKQLRAHRVQGARSWLGYYKDRDSKEAREALERIPAEMRQACRQMHSALRKTTLPLETHGGADDLVLADASEADKVVEWRRQNGKPDTVAFHHCVGNGQLAQGCTYVRVGEALVCSSSGWAHFCDDTCSERIVTRSSGMMVCPISGRCFETLMTEAEEQAMRGGCGEVYDDDHYYEKGSLGRSFQMGYNCTDEKDLERVCGVKFR